MKKTICLLFTMMSATIMYAQIYEEKELSKAELPESLVYFFRVGNDSTRLVYKSFDTHSSLHDVASIIYADVNYESSKVLYKAVKEVISLYDIPRVLRIANRSIIIKRSIGPKIIMQIENMPPATFRINQVDDLFWFVNAKSK